VRLKYTVNAEALPMVLVFQFSAAHVAWWLNL
jgi:hypothetical protein